MPSPLSQFYNTVLVLPELSSNIGTNDLGDPVIVPGLDVEYKAYLKKSTKDPTVSYQSGVNSNKQYFVGYIVEPTSLPIDLKLPVTVSCRKRRGKSNTWIEGKFEILPEYLPIAIVEDVLGDYISGFFWHA